MTALREELEKLAEQYQSYRYYDVANHDDLPKLALAAANLALEAAAKMADEDEDAYASKMGGWPEAAAYNQGREHEAASLCAAIRAMRVG